MSGASPVQGNSREIKFIMVVLAPVSQYTEFNKSIQVAIRRSIAEVSSTSGLLPGLEVAPAAVAQSYGNQNHASGDNSPRIRID